MTTEEVEISSGREPFNVLCIDGGGMRGLYSACLLDTVVRRMSAHLDNRSGDLGRSFDLICGTSTGSILAVALAEGVPLGKVEDLYSIHGPKIFTWPYPKKASRIPVIGRLLTTPWILGHLWGPSASAKALREGLHGIFGERTLGDLYVARKIALCIPAVNASNRQAMVFKTPHQTKFNRDQSVRLVDACMASSAAPIYLPLHKFPIEAGRDRDDVYIDGGLWANSPVLVGIIEALDLAGTRPIRVISVGACDEPTGDPSVLGRQDWGVFRWMAGIGVMEASMSAQTSGHLDMARLLIAQLKRREVDITMCRLEGSQKSPGQHSSIGIDRADSTALRTLRSLAENDANELVSLFHRSEKAEIAAAVEILSKVPSFNKE